MNYKYFNPTKSRYILLLNKKKKIVYVLHGDRIVLLRVFRSANIIYLQI